MKRRGIKVGNRWVRTWPEIFDAKETPAHNFVNGNETKPQLQRISLRMGLILDVDGLLISWTI